MKNYAELKKEFDENVEKLQKECKHEDISDWMEEWWAIAHSTGWQVKICTFCHKVVARKTRCTTCGKELVEDTDSIKFVTWAPYCENCAPVAEAEEKEMKDIFERGMKKMEEGF